MIGPRPAGRIAGEAATGEARHRRIAARPAARARAAALPVYVLAALALAACTPAACAPAPARAAPAECRAGPARAETLDGVGPRGELRFASGARAVLDSLRWPDDIGEGAGEGAGEGVGEGKDAGADAAAARAWLDARRGARLAVVPRGGQDRWGRERVDAQVEAGGDKADPAADPAIDLAGGLIAAGLALADPGEADALCRPALRAVEAGARARGLGLWRRPAPAAEDGPALRALAGTFAVVEGRVRHVGERATRTYLDFAPRGGDGLTVTMSKRTWRTLRARGLSADAIEGRRVRVRGVLEVRRGPAIEAAADAVELLGEAPGEGAPAGPAGERGLRR